ncbi:G5 domain-containing protein [Actinoplanes couchii]|uniref:G5 domain-containing protein n=1 Tax=Actinoplanes couchii TaxID=403638 RepID=A0ABQ3X6S2_9ACTN|nr:G5 domain-containing protein [Actinoplanes couchii]MDR6325189.1 hypothetical protein [Actinoplanes couchii]GID54105.1 hypothetical protein Aco03nite_025090 [Actinoplanes couchii]
MAAGAAAMFVVVGGSAAGVATILAPEPESVTVAEPDLGAPYLEEDPEVVSRAAAAAQPLPRRPGDMPPPAQKTPVKPKAAGKETVKQQAPAARKRVYTASDRLSRQRVTDDRADRTGPRQARVAGTGRTGGTQARKAPAAEAPVVTTRTDLETRIVPYGTEVVKDATMLRGTRRVEADGEPGEETLRYLVTLTDGRPTARRLLGSSITTRPLNRVVAVGSRKQSVVDPFCDNVLGICLPFSRDAD